MSGPNNPGQLSPSNQQLAQALAAQQAAAQMYQQQQEGPVTTVHPSLHHQHIQMIQQFWANQMSQIETEEPDFKQHALPLARIKKVMKTDDDVRNKMISAEAPILFSKACEIFILELTMRAWIHTEENKRRTLQRSDIATAISKTDVFDFLIDIVPRDDANKGPSMVGKRESLPQFQQQFYAAAPGTVYPPVTANAGPPMPGVVADPNLMAYQQMQQYMRMMGTPPQGQEEHKETVTTEVNNNNIVNPNGGVEESQEGSEEDEDEN